MLKCEECGLFSSTDKQCAWFKKKRTEKEIVNSSDCAYFIEINYEDGLPLKPYQHLILKQEDLASKKMKMK